MGKDWVPATVSNNSNRGIVLIILDGDCESAPTRESFLELTSGESSDTILRSVDAFGAYHANRSVEIVWNGHSSPWWRISDGTTCSVQDDGDQLVLKIIERLAHMPPPRPSRAEDWGFEWQTRKSLKSNTGGVSTELR